MLIVKIIAPGIPGSVKHDDVQQCQMPFTQFMSCCIQYRYANVTTTGIEEAGNDHGRTAIIQSFKECFFICYLSFICAQKYEISSLF